jgi:lipopolysaccharide export system permease protein
VARFDRYVLSQLMVAFGLFALVLVLVYWINRAVRLFDQIIASGESATVFLELSLLTLPNVIKLVLPVAAFAATVYVTNRLSNESELVVVQAPASAPGGSRARCWSSG